MKHWVRGAYFISILFAIQGLIQSFALAQAPKSQKILTATTNAYPGEHTEIWVEVNNKGELIALVLEEYNLDEPRRKTLRFTIEQVNSAEGAPLKTQFTVQLLVLKGRGKGLNALGGPVDLEFRKSNWFSEMGKFPIFLSRNKQNQWITQEQDAKGKLLDKLKIQVWTGFGFGVDDVRAE